MTAACVFSAAALEVALAESAGDFRPVICSTASREHAWALRTPARTTQCLKLLNSGFAAVGTSGSSIQSVYPTSSEPSFSASPTDMVIGAKLTTGSSCVSSVVNSFPSKTSFPVLVGYTTEKRSVGAPGEAKDAVEGITSGIILARSSADTTFDRGSRDISGCGREKRCAMNR